MIAAFDSPIESSPFIYGEAPAGVQPVASRRGALRCCVASSSGGSFDSPVHGRIGKQNRDDLTEATPSEQRDFFILTAHARSSWLSCARRLGTSHYRRIWNT